MNLTRLDPRIKLLLLIGISTSALFMERPAALLALLFLSLLILLSGGVTPGVLWRKSRAVFGLIVSLFLIQCIFTRGGEPLIVLFGLTLVTDSGLLLAVSVNLRLIIIVLSALIVLTGEPRDYLLAMTQCKIPYTIAFMTLAALRFLPMLREEARDVVCAAQMRGLRIKKTGLRNKARAYISIILPVTAGAVRRAERLSVAMEARAFRAYPRRTSARRLRLRAADLIYLALFCAAIAAIIVIF
ncbi:MAG: energy-coupling factor transporter transmembrane protein EcfT [Oscillospiraceae bacterium]|jgi:energy-coupling factor transport system permease protein|nr:energy-coupling factor transporter transmembrane protein EcfT [Oscillospiraceae bacterium]